MRVKVNVRFLDASGVPSEDDVIVFHTEFQCDRFEQIEQTFLTQYNIEFAEDHGHTPSIDAVAELYDVLIVIH